MLYVYVILAEVETRLLRMTCQKAFAEFKTQYGKVYPDAADEAAHLDQFCINFETLKKHLKEGCETCGLSSVMDVDWESLRRPNPVIAKMKLQAEQDPQHLTATNCYSGYCYGAYPYDSITPLTSVDLREYKLSTPAKQQGSCGACWTFSLASSLENLVLRDIWANASGLVAPWSQFNVSTMDASEQFIGMNDFGFGSFCNGGDSHSGALWIYEKIGTMELESNFPYTGQEGDFATRRSSGTLVARKVQVPYVPFKVFTNVVPGTSSPLVPSIRIFHTSYDYSTSADAAALNLVKQHLSRGFSIPISMYADSVLDLYKGGGKVIHSDCKAGTTDQPVNHAVSLVGFGKKANTDVFIIKNSWGTSFGDQGHFFVPVGRNSFCIELYLYALASQYYDPASDNAVLPKLTNVTRSNSWELDPESGCQYTYQGTCVSECPTGSKLSGQECLKSGLSITSIGLIAGAGGLVLLIAAISMCCCCCRKSAGVANTFIQQTPMVMRSPV